MTFNPDEANFADQLTKLTADLYREIGVDEDTFILELGSLRSLALLDDEKPKITYRLTGSSSA